VNQDPYDYYEQYRVSFGPGWDHATVCGLPFVIPMKLGNNAPVSFWSNGIPQSTCNIAIYQDAAETRYVKFQVGQESKPVTDTYTGLTQTVTQLTYDPSYCKANSTLTAVCSGSSLQPTLVPQPVPGNDDPDARRILREFARRPEAITDSGRTPGTLNPYPGPSIPLPGMLATALPHRP
jgi:hypothetical protein